MTDEAVTKEIRTALDIIRGMRTRYIVPICINDDYSPHSNESLELRTKISSFLNKKLWFRGFEGHGDYAVFSIVEGARNISRALEHPEIIKRKGIDVLKATDDIPPDYIIRRTGKPQEAYLSNSYYPSLRLPLAEENDQYDPPASLLKCILELSEHNYLSTPR